MKYFRNIITLITFLFLLLDLSACDSLNSNDTETNTDEVAEGTEELKISIDNSCYFRSEYCEESNCLYTIPCSCLSDICLTSPSTPTLSWGGSNETDREITIVKTIMSYIQASSNTTIVSYECEYESLSMDPGEERIYPTVSCIQEEPPAGYEPPPTGVGYADAQLKFTVVYLDEEGKEVESSVIGNIQILGDNAL